MKKKLRSCTAWLLAFCLLLGVCSNGLAVIAVESDSNDPIKYVSLGDSMTNGYGLDGYEYEYHCMANHSHSDRCGEPWGSGSWYGWNWINWVNGGWTGNYDPSAYANVGFTIKCQDGTECTDPDCTEPHLVFEWANGYRQAAYKGYPNLLAQHYGWELTQLAMSATRVEDIRWILDFDLNDPEQLKVAYMNDWNGKTCRPYLPDGCAGCGDCMIDGKYTEELWNEVFTCGDFYTFDRFPDGRLEYPYPYVNLNGNLGRDGDHMEAVIADYQNSVANADVISLCIGNGNFGVGMLNRLMDAFAGGDDTWLYPLEPVLAQLNEEEQAQLLAIEEMLKENMTISELGEEKSEIIIDIMLYSTASYMVNYKGLIQTLVKLNPDAEIILIGMVESMKGFSIAAGDDIIPLGDIVDICTEFANSYTATVVSGLQETEEFAEAEFYYADATEDVELLYEIFDETVYDKNNVTVRDRFFETITNWLWYPAEVAAKAMGAPYEEVWIEVGDGLELHPYLGYTGAEYDEDGDMDDVGFTLSDVIAYEEDPSSVDESKHFAIQLYLGIEKAVVDSCKDGVLTMTGLALCEAADPTVGFGAVAEAMKDAPADGFANYFANALLADPDVKSIMYQNARCDIGNYLGNHPSEAGHKVMFESVVKAYDGKYTVKDEADIAEEKMIGIIMDYLKENGYVDAAKAKAIAFAKSQAKQVWDLVEGELKPAAAKMEAELEALYEELAGKLDELNNELAPYVAEQEQLLADMIAERDALIEELEALNAKLEAIKNGSYGRSATTASAKDQMIAELEADIAATEAQIAELDATIAWVAEQLRTDKSGIEAIKAAIADIKAKIATTETALAEVNAAIDQLVADLIVLNDALELLAKVADALANKVGIDVELEEIVAAVQVVIEKLPEIIKNIEFTYEKVVEIIADVEDAIAEIKASAALIEENVKNLIASAEEFADIVGDEAAIIVDSLEEMAEIVEAFVDKNLPRVENVLNRLNEKLEALVLRKLAKAEALWEENKEVAYAAIGVTYWYCIQRGYVAEAKELIFKYTKITQEDIDAVQEDLCNAEEVLLKQIGYAIDWLKAEKPVWEARLAELKEDLKEAVDAETKAAIKAAIAEVEAKIDEIEEKIEQAEELIDAVCDYFEEVYEAIEDVRAALVDLDAAIALVGEDVKGLWNALKNLKSALCELHASVVVLRDAVVDEATKLLGYCGMIVDEAIDVVETLDDYVALLRYIPAIIEEAYIDATTDNYLVSIDSHYVALGDKNAYGTAADKLADELSKFLGAEIGFDNLTVEGQSAEELQALLSEYAAAIEKADLVTVGFSANTFTQFVVDQLTEALAGGTPAELNWEAHLGEQGAAYMAEAMAALKAELIEAGAGEYMGMDIADIVVLAVESYAYSYVEFVIHYVQAVEGIHAINPNAQVVLVGMHNPMAGVVLNVEGTEIALGDYLEYLVDVSNLYSLGYAVVASQTIFVEAPAVETVNVPGVQDVLFFVMDLMMNGTESYVPTEAGHSYIQEQIWNALNVYKVGMLGDVDSDGDVDYVDSMLTLQYYTREIGAEDLDVSVADVDGNGVVNYVDAMLILQHYTHEIAVFPAA